MPQVLDGVIVVEETDGDGNTTEREATLAEQNALILQALDDGSILA